MTGGEQERGELKEKEEGGEVKRREGEKEINMRGKI